LVKLPEPKNRTAAAIFARHERDAEDWRRPHLGASVIGDENCLRHLWYSFRWASHHKFDGRLLRLFERGHREEAWIVEELRALGWEVQDVDPDTGEQRRFAYFGGHFGGSIDGAVLGVLEAPKTWHLLEVKTSNDKRFKLLQKEGVAKAQPGHHAQMQIYMHALGLTRALYVCVNKNDDYVYTERVRYDREFAEAILRKAEGVIAAAEPLSKINEDPAWFECKLCDHRPICHLEQVELLERNCRTCASSTPLPTGRWICEHHGNAVLSVDDQRRGCEDHLFVPSLLPWEWVDYSYGARARRVIYRRPDGATVVDSGRQLTVNP
jgi:hypothetical protein